MSSRHVDDSDRRLSRVEEAATKTAEKKSSTKKLSKHSESIVVVDNHSSRKKVANKTPEVAVD